MSATRDLPARPSLDSLRKQARRLARAAAAGDGHAIARVHAQVPRATLPLSNRDAQLVIAREYGFAGWPALTAEVRKRQGDPLDRAASQAKIAIYHENYERLRALLAELPALASWRDGDHSLLDSTTSYAMDCADPERERTYTRPAAAELLVDAGATVERDVLANVINTGSSGMLQLLARKGALPRTLDVLAALGDDAEIRSRLEQPRPHGVALDDVDDETIINRAFMTACRFKHAELAGRLLDRSIALDPELGRRIERWQSRDAFIEFLTRQPGLLWQEPGLTPWQTFVVLQLGRARDRDDLAAFRRWLGDEPWVLERGFMGVQTALMLPACYGKDRERFIDELLERDPAILHADSPPAARWTLIPQALSHGNARRFTARARLAPAG